MSDFALVALPGAYHSSVGAMTDSFLLARDRVEHIFAGVDPVRMETGLRLLSQDGGPVSMANGMQLAVEGALDSHAAHAFIWLPAFRVCGPEALRHRLAESRPLLGWLQGQAEKGAIIGASGGSAMLLAAAGLTGTLPLPVARALKPLMRATFPRQPLEERRALVDHGHLLVSIGLGFDLPLIVRVIERTLSPDIARWLGSIMGLDSVDQEMIATDALVAQAQLWLEQNFAGQVNIAGLADTLSTSPATLNRRFQKALGMSPRDYVQHLRMQAAIRMLEKSGRSIDRIAQLVGYSDSRLFRTMFRQHMGMTATQWRAQALAKATPSAS